MVRMPRATGMFMRRAAASFPTSCLDSSNRRPGRRLNQNWRREARAEAYGSISPLACAGCGAEGHVATVVQPPRKTAAIQGCRTTRRPAPELELVDCSHLTPTGMNQRAVSYELDRSRVI